QKNAKVHSIGFFEERAIDRRSQRAPFYIAEQYHYVELQIIDRAMKLLERMIRRIHRNRGKSLEALGVSCDKLGVGVVECSRHFGLAALIGEEDVRGRQRDDFDIDAYAIHVFE